MTRTGVPPSDLDQAATAVSVHWTRAAEVGLALRQATAEDLPFLLHLHVAARRSEFGRTGWPQDQITALLNEQARIQLAAYRRQSPDAEWRVIQDGTAPIGRLLLDVRTDAIALVDIIIAQACRSRGLGSAVIADILAAAARSGTGVVLHVETSNRARTLYKRLGFATLDRHGPYEAMVYRGPTAGGSSSEA